MRMTLVLFAGLAASLPVAAQSLPPDLQHLLDPAAAVPAMHYRPITAISTPAQPSSPSWPGAPRTTTARSPAPPSMPDMNMDMHGAHPR